MTLDWIDRAFVSGTAPLPAHPSRSPDHPSRSPALPSPAPPSPAQRERDEVPAGRSHGVDDDLVTRLLAAAPEAWDALADSAAASAREGRPVIAVTGAAAGEGRSTVVAALAATLRQRGLRVVTTPTAPLFLAAAAAAEARAAAIVIVDAGPWFTAGPLRRAAIERSALGCDAVIVVRRESASPSPARLRCLSDIGLAVLGETLTFVEPAAA